MLIAFFSECNDIPTQWFRWNPASFLLKLELPGPNYNLCLKSSSNTTILAKCDPKDDSQRFLASDGLIRMSHVGNWANCLVMPPVENPKEKQNDVPAQINACIGQPTDTISFVIKYKIDSKTGVALGDHLPKTGSIGGAIGTISPGSSLSGFW